MLDGLGVGITKIGSASVQGRNKGEEHREGANRDFYATFHLLTVFGGAPGVFGSRRTSFS
jgi:hypothetical protein